MYVCIYIYTHTFTYIHIYIWSLMGKIKTERNCHWSSSTILFYYIILYIKSKRILIRRFSINSTRRISFWKNHHWWVNSQRVRRINKAFSKHMNIVCVSVCVCVMNPPIFEVVSCMHDTTVDLILIHFLILKSEHAWWMRALISTAISITLWYVQVANVNWDSNSWHGIFMSIQFFKK